MSNSKQGKISPMKHLQPTLVVNKEEGLKVAGTQILPLLDEPARQRFKNTVDDSAGPNACHPFTNCLSNGYGRFWLGERNEQAHRVAWVMANGEEIPISREIHHTCQSRACQNPAHLQAVSHSANMEAVEGPISEEEYMERARAHRARRQIASLPIDAGVQFLRWTWNRVHKSLGLFPPPVGTQEKNWLRRLLQHAGERAACLAICEIIKSWDGFVPHGAGEYALWNTNEDWAPKQPSLSVLKSADGIAAVVTFWFNNDEVELARLRHAAEQRKQEAERRYWDEVARRRESLARREREEWRQIDQEGPPFTDDEWQYLDLNEKVQLAIISQQRDIDAERARRTFVTKHPKIGERLYIRRANFRSRVRSETEETCTPEKG